MKLSNFKWVPYNKGGERRQWYGNYDYIVNWRNNGEGYISQIKIFISVRKIDFKICHNNRSLPKGNKL